MLHLRVYAYPLGVRTRERERDRVVYVLLLLLLSIWIVYIDLFWCFGNTVVATFMPIELKWNERERARAFRFIDDLRDSLGWNDTDGSQTNTHTHTHLHADKIIPPVPMATPHDWQFSWLHSLAVSISVWLGSLLPLSLRVKGESNQRIPLFLWLCPRCI